MTTEQFARLPAGAIVRWRSPSSGELADRGMVITTEDGEKAIQWQDESISDRRDEFAIQHSEVEVA
jgi:hypothetical protein